jgi:hypothetical protein
VTEVKVTPWKVSLSSGVVGLLPPVNLDIYYTTGAINVIIGSSDAVTANDIINQQVDVFTGTDIILKRWYLEEDTDTSGSCVITVSSETFGGTHGAIDGGNLTTNTGSPRMVNQLDSSGTTAGWTTTTVGAGGCMRVKVISATTIKKISLGLIFWRANR